MRPIDADAYAAELWKMRQNYQMLDDTQTADKIMHGLYRAEQALKEAPTIDAMPVEEAEWILFSERDGRVNCSKCNAIFNAWQGYVYNYCPICGRKMKRKEKIDADS